MKSWKLEDAKNGFSEVVRRALAHQPQRVTRRGRDAVVVVSAEDYAKLTGTQNLVDFLRNSPLAEAFQAGELDLTRQRDYGREIDL
jgi:prevent-host-death family protein